MRSTIPGAFKGCFRKTAARGKRDKSNHGANVIARESLESISQISVGSFREGKEREREREKNRACENYYQRWARRFPREQRENIKPVTRFQLTSLARRLFGSSIRRLYKQIISILVTPGTRSFTGFSNADEIDIVAPASI